MFRPNLWLHRVTDITPQMLTDIGVTALFLDVDNTLSTHHGTKITEGFFEWKENMQQNGISLMIVSNSKRFRIEPFARRVGLPFVSLATKPLPRGYIKASKTLGVALKHCAIAGDQIFTDVLGAKFCFCKAILTEPIKLEDKFSFKVRRKAEKFLKAHFKKKGWF